MKGYWRAFTIGLLFCLAFNYVATVSLNRGGPILPSNQVSSFGFVFLILVVVLVNPILRLLRQNKLSGKEMAVIATMALAPAGVAGFGFVTEFIPFAANLHNPRYEAKFEEHVIPHVREEFFVQTPEGETQEEFFATYNEGLRVRQQESFPVFLPKDGRLGEYFPDLWRYFFGGNPDQRTFWGAIPWGAWLTPLLSWGAFFLLVIAFFYALNELMFKQWYDNEKLVFPHTELLHSVLGMDDQQGGLKIYQGRAFWVGFSVSFVIMLYNGLSSAGWLPGLSTIDLRGSLDPYLTDTWLEPLTPFWLSTFFAAIGLAFLLPAEISFSIWFFFIFLRFQQLLAVHSGYAPSANALRGDWFVESSMLTCQGGGGMLVFTGVCLWKVRHRLLAWVYRLISREDNKQLSAEDLKEHMWPSLLFFLASMGIIGVFWWAGVGLAMSLLYYLLIVCVTVVSVRLVAEGGLIGFQLWYGPLHVIRHLGLFKFGALFHIKGMAAAMPLFCSLFLDVKTFLASSMMTCKALAYRAQTGKVPFAVAIGVSFLVSLVLSCVVSLALVYDLGINSMQGWFYQAFPSYALGTVNSVAGDLEHYSFFDTDQVAWTAVGGAMMALILVGRRFFFWIPHPIGMMIFINPIVQRYWFSFFLAWVFKSFAVRYCKPDTYQQVKIAFMGLFLGELTVVAIAALVALFGWGNMAVSMNR